MMHEEIGNEVLMIDIQSENRINIIIGIPYKNSKDYHDWNYEVVRGIDMEYIEDYFNAISQ